MNALELNNVEKTFGSFKLNLDLKLPEGCIMGLVGENGAGKTTCIKMLLGMLKPDNGSTALLGQVNGGSLSSVKEDVGVVLDEPAFPDMLNVAQVDKIMRNIYRRWNSALFFGYIQKLSVPHDKLFKELSRGMKMKLSIAVALAHEPKLLILDEPTSGLDPVVRDEVVDIFLDFTRDESHSILISSHIVSDLEKLCDYIAFIHKGKLLLCEEKDMLAEKYGLFRGSNAELGTLPKEAVLGKRENSYGVSAIVRRDMVDGIELSPVSIEELFILMAKEA